ncbi:MAG: DUF3782 domain-containing protein [Deltaproteobacteria bacterium]|nr:DUF3782 domain-containing protein [Deltaproteobacteria bacterium]MCL5276183.1 DUF3782 domain-containing protein [Deltaproteobacteria bacterium]
MKHKPKQTKQVKRLESKEPEGGYSALKGKDVEGLAESILKLIGDDRQKRATLVGLLVSDVATRQEFTTLLRELKAMREASDAKFDAMQRDMDRKFEASERRFEAIEGELKAMREASDAKFDAMQRDMDRKFEASERRFEAIEGELKAMREDSDRKFEAIDKRFEAIDKKFEELRIDLDKRFEALDKSLTRKMDMLGSRWGIMAEDSFREGYDQVLKETGYSVVKWKKVDASGTVFSHPREVEIDILITDGRAIAIEVKSSVTKGEVEAFDGTIEFYEKTEGKKIDARFIVGVYPYPGVVEYAKQYGIKVVGDMEAVIKDPGGD